MAEAASELASCKLEYELALSKDLLKDDFVIIDVRVFECNILIPKLVSSFELDVGSGWFGWSEI